MIWNIFEYLATFVEYAIYADFMVRFLTPKKKENNIFCYLVIFIINIALTLMFNHFMNYEGVFGIVRISINFVISLFLLKGTVFEKLFVSFILDISALMISFLSLETLGILTDRTVEEMIEFRGLIRLLNLFITKALLFTVTRLLLRIKGNKRYCFSLSEWITIGIIFVLTMFIGLGIFRVDLDAGISSETPMSICIGIGLISINILVYILMKRISEKNIENTDLVIDKMQNELYRLEFENSEKQYIEINKIRHDMKNHLQCIAAFISEKEYSKANDYIENILKSKLIFGYNQINTGNRVVDIISNIKLMQCQNENILTNVQAGKFETTIEAVDLCSLLGNVFDNAIEACRNVKSDKVIYFNIAQKKEYINIVIKNSICKSVLQNNSDLNTTKLQKDIHGYGLKSVRDIVHKHNGMMDLYEENDLFVADIWLPCQNIE